MIQNRWYWTAGVSLARLAGWKPATPSQTNRLRAHPTSTRANAHHQEWKRLWGRPPYRSRPLRPPPTPLGHAPQARRLQLNRDFHNRGRDNENFDLSFFHTPAYADAASLAEFHQIMAGAEEPKEAADAMKVTDSDSKKAKKAAMKKARKDEQKTEAGKLVKRKKLPKPKGGLQPLVSAIYRPAKARGGQ